MATNNSTQLPPKPIPLRVVFILNALMMFLPFIFYYVITSKEITIGGLDPQIMIYTGIAYIISFIPLVYFIVKRNVIGFRIMFIVNVIIALPAKAYIGILVAIVSTLISFFNKKVKEYFLLID